MVTCDDDDTQQEPWIVQILHCCKYDYVCLYFVALHCDCSSGATFVWLVALAGVKYLATNLAIIDTEIPFQALLRFFITKRM